MPGVFPMGVAGVNTEGKVEPPAHPDILEGCP